MCPGPVLSHARDGVQGAYDGYPDCRKNTFLIITALSALTVPPTRVVESCSLLLSGCGYCDAAGPAANQPVLAPSTMRLIRLCRLNRPSSRHCSSKSRVFPFGTELSAPQGLQFCWSNVTTDDASDRPAPEHGGSVGATVREALSRRLKWSCKYGTRRTKASARREWGRSCVLRLLAHRLTPAEKL